MWTCTENARRRHARAGLDRLVHVVADVGERDDVVWIDLAAIQALRIAPLMWDVLAPGELNRTQFQQRGDAAMRLDQSWWWPAARWR